MDYEGLCSKMHAQAYQEFVASVIAGKREFTLLLESNVYLIFMSRCCGAAKLYYVATCYNESEMVDETASFQLVAIYNGTNIFMMDRYLFRENGGIKWDKD